MAEQFLKTDNDGMINLRFVRRITGGKDEKYRAHFDNGDSCSFWAKPSHINNLEKTIVPASAGEYAVFVSVENEPNEEPTEVWTQLIRIVAWAMDLTSSDYADPVFVEGVCSNTHVLLPQPDGQLLAVGDRTYANIEEAKASILRDAVACHRRKVAAWKAAATRAVPDA